MTISVAASSIFLAGRDAEPGAPPPAPAPASRPEPAAGSCLISDRLLLFTGRLVGNPLEPATAASARNGVLGHDAAVVSVTAAP
ncbi:hypothetical protein J4573_28430 [Actinomadura barringtoniae]|uniref:Uncharacterized protein n=1 Tax=Actinomadura barringtoniae TaxID=1427535 RepID=A0A939T3F4_9ACTN|nr:hypothetical protein [Actinomadura barringtoniae]MBO2451056.1 hypothetical protein [Actinomadura barringtoniae]